MNAERRTPSDHDALRRRPTFSGVAFGSAVLSASPGASLGGDVVDIFDLDRRFGLIVVADICGKGTAAAAQAAFIRYTIRTLAIESDGDPAVVLAKFNTIYCRTVDDYEAFVVLIIGIVDSQSGEVRYASAGHEPAFVKRGATVSLLPPTGPIVGVSPFCAYRTATVTLGPQDMLIWTTDGLTESRNPAGSLLGTDGLASWIAAGPADVDAMAAGLIAGLRQRSGTAAGDDVAVLTVACAPVPTGVAAILAR
jgi:sigma-B regulation protein RsbU (phosphoserine phosphatase)